HARRAATACGVQAVYSNHVFHQANNLRLGQHTTFSLYLDEHLPVSLRFKLSRKEPLSDQNDRLVEERAVTTLMAAKLPRLFAAGQVQVSHPPLFPKPLRR